MRRTHFKSIAALLLLNVFPATESAMAYAELRPQYREITYDAIRAELTALDSLTAPPQAIRALIASANSALAAQAHLEDSPQMDAELAALGDAQRKALQKANFAKNRDVRLALIELWQNLVDSERLLRHLFGHYWSARLVTAIGTMDDNTALEAAGPLARLGDCESTNALIDAAEAFQNDTVTSESLVALIAEESHECLGSAYLLKRLSEKPTLPLLRAVATSGLPTYTNYQWMLRHKAGEKEKPKDEPPGTPTSWQLLRDFLTRMSVRGERREEQRRQREREEMRGAVRRAVDHLAAEFPEARALSEPLLTDAASRDSEGPFLKTHGMILREGDLVALREAPEQMIWEGLTTTPTRHSALGVLTFDTSAVPYIARQSYTRLRLVPFRDALLSATHLSFFRKAGVRAIDRERIRATIEGMASEQCPFDYRYNIQDEGAMYGSEAAFQIYHGGGIIYALALHPFANDNTTRFAIRLGIQNNAILTVSSFLEARGMEFLGAIDRGGARRLIQENTAAQTVAARIAQAESVDFSRLKDAPSHAYAINLFRRLNVGQLGGMTPELARTLKGLEWSVAELARRTDTRLSAEQVPLADVGRFITEAARLSAEEAGPLLEGVFESRPTLLQ